MQTSASTSTDGGIGNLRWRGRGAIWLGALFVFGASWLGLSLSANTTSFDSKFALYAAISLLREGNLNLDEYGALTLFPGGVRVDQMPGMNQAHGHVYDFFPIGTPIVAAPFVGVAALWDRLRGDSLAARMMRERPVALEQNIAALIVALSATLVCLLASFYLTPPRATALALLYAFGTGAWSTAALALWQHGPLLLMFALVLALVAWGECSGRNLPIGLAGLPLGFMYWIRPTSALLIGLVTLWVLTRRVWAARLFLVTLALALVPFFAHSLRLYGTPVPPYYQPSRIGARSQFWEALAGNLVSPGRGIFVFSPVLLFAFVGGWLKWKRGAWSLLDTLLAGFVVAHLLAISSFPHWWGGHSLGPRLMTDTLPVFVWFLIPLFQSDVSVRGVARLSCAVLLSLCAGFSIFVQYRLANRTAAKLWSVRPANIDRSPDRLWDWRDLQFLR